MESGPNELKDFLPINRRLFRNPLWTSPREFSQFEAWLWILVNARYSPDPGYYQIGKKKIIWKQGQVPGSKRFLAEKWGWPHHNKVVRFLKKLVAEEMITINTEQGISVLHLVNHEKYNPHIYGAKPAAQQPQTPRAPTQRGKKPPKPITTPKLKSHKIAYSYLQLFNKISGLQLELYKTDVQRIVSATEGLDSKAVEKGIKAFMADKWINEKGLTARFDLFFKSRNEVQQYIAKANAKKPIQNGTPATPQPKQPIDALNIEQAKKHATTHRRVFSPQFYQKITHNGKTLYQPKFN